MKKKDPVETIGFVGLGVMGRPMAVNLARRFALLVYDKDPARLSGTQGKGIRRASSLEELGRQAGIVLLSLPGSAAVEEVIAGRSGLGETLGTGGVVIDTGTTEPAVSQRLAGLLAGRGITLLDAPVSGGEKGAVEATLSVMVGGPQEAFSRCRDIFAAIGKTIVRVGDSGMGQVAKLVNNLIVGATFAALAEGFTLAVKSGLDPQKLFEAIRGGWAGSKVLEVSAPAMLERKFDPGGTVDILYKDLGYALALARSTDVPLPITVQTHEIFKAAKAAGYGGRSQPVIVNLWEKLLGIEVKRAKRPG